MKVLFLAVIISIVTAAPLHLITNHGKNTSFEAAQPSIKRSPVLIDEGEGSGPGAELVEATETEILPDPQLTTVVSTGGWCTPWGTDGGDIGGYLAPACDTDCAIEACARIANCVGFTYNKDTSRFKLKSQISGVTAHSRFECHRFNRGEYQANREPESTRATTRTTTRRAGCVDLGTPCFASKQSWGSGYTCNEREWCTDRSWKKDYLDCCPRFCGRCPSATDAPTDAPTGAPTAPPAAPDCEDNGTWDAGYGQCNSYAKGSKNHAHCKTDSSDNVLAKDACKKSCDNCPVDYLVGCDRTVVTVLDFCIQGSNGDLGGDQEIQLSVNGVPIWPETGGFGDIDEDSCKELRPVRRVTLDNGEDLKMDVVEEGIMYDEEASTTLKFNQWYLKRDECGANYTIIMAADFQKHQVQAFCVHDCDAWTNPENSYVWKINVHVPAISSSTSSVGDSMWDVQASTPP